MNKKKCKKGAPCGGSCISYKKACRVEFPEGVSVSLSEGREIIKSGTLSKEGKFPDSLDSLVKVENLGGSTGAELLEDPKTKKLYVAKKGNSEDHIREENYADLTYKAFGVAVPDSKMYDTDTGPLKLAEFIKGTPIGDLRGEALEKANREIQKGYAVDAVLGNWDVIGMSGDNSLVDSSGKVWRIDNGGSLRFRAQGAPKGNAWGDNASEIESLRRKNGTNFGSLSDQEIDKQVKALKSLDVKLPPSLPEDLSRTIKARVNNLSLK